MEVSAFPTGENEVTAQAIFLIDDANSGALRPMPISDSIARVNAVEITTQFDRDRRMAMSMSQNPHGPVEDLRLSENFGNPYSNVSSTPWDGWGGQVQPMEFEQTSPMRRPPQIQHVAGGFEVIEDHFDMLEYMASSRIRQFFTCATCIVICQFILLVAMICIKGFASFSENPTIGPPIMVMIQFQAKQASLMVYEKQWLRLIFSIFLHSGLIHFIPLMIVQMRVGGYLNIIFGTPVYLWIYVVSGVFGNMLACVAAPTTVSMGCGASLAGILASWFCYIFFRWKTVQQDFPSFTMARNRQIMICGICFIVVFLVSFCPFVDFVGLIGGAIQGACWSSIYFCKELNHRRHRRRIRLCAFLLSALLIGLIGWYLADGFLPPRSLVEYYSNDDDFNP